MVLTNPYIVFGIITAGGSALVGATVTVYADSILDTVVDTTLATGAYQVDLMDLAQCDDGSTITVVASKADYPTTTSTFTLDISDGFKVVNIDINIGGMKWIMPDLLIYYDTLDGSNYITCWCSRWDIDNYSVIVETWLNKTQWQTLLNNITPGAVGELYNILGRPHFYDQTWQGNNTLRLKPNTDSVSNLKNMRFDTIIYPKNITTIPLEGLEGWLSIKIEGYISGSNRQL